MIARGLFHSIKSLSKRLCTEFETPVDKLDLVRSKDAMEEEVNTREESLQN